MTDQRQLEVGAECLAMDVADAKSHSRMLADDVLLVWGAKRGLGSVLVGENLDVLYFNSSVSPVDALAAFRSGRRTPREKFTVFQSSRP